MTSRQTVNQLPITDTRMILRKYLTPVLAVAFLLLLLHHIDYRAAAIQQFGRNLRMIEQLQEMPSPTPRRVRKACTENYLDFHVRAKSS